MKRPIVITSQDKQRLEDLLAVVAVSELEEQIRDGEVEDVHPALVRLIRERYAARAPVASLPRAAA